MGVWEIPAPVGEILADADAVAAEEGRGVDDGVGLTVGMTEPIASLFLWHLSGSEMEEQFTGKSPSPVVPLKKSSKTWSRAAEQFVSAQAADELTHSVRLTIASQVELITHNEQLLKAPMTQSAGQLVMTSGPSENPREFCNKSSKVNSAKFSRASASAGEIEQNPSS